MTNEVKDFFREWLPAIVSISALVVAFFSYQISKNQLKISTVSVEPHFYIAEVPLYDEIKKFWYERELKIFNIGHPVANIETNIQSFYKVDDSGDIGEKWIPISGYYYANFPTGEPSRIITTYKGQNNATHDHEARFNYNRENGNSFLNIELIHFTEISYKKFDGKDSMLCFLNEKVTSCNDNILLNSKDSEPLKLQGLTYENIVAMYNSEI